VPNGYSISINWSTADVKADRDSLALRVDLSEEPDTYWKSAFGELREEFNSSLVRSGQDWWVNSPHRDELGVGGLREDVSLEEVRDELDTLVSRANQRAQEIRTASEQDQAKRAADHERLQAQADEMTRQLREG